MYSIYPMDNKIYMFGLTAITGTGIIISTNVFINFVKYWAKIKSYYFLTTPQLKNLDAKIWSVLIIINYKCILFGFLVNKLV